MAAESPPVPYAADDATLHLWHLDEDKPPFADSGRSPRPLEGLLNGAAAGTPALPGFGKSVSFNYARTHEPETSKIYGPILLSKPKLDSAQGDQVDAPFPIMGDDGAFTIEAIVKLDALPEEARGLAYGIVTLDDEVPGQRVFLLRIEKPGFLAFLPISGTAVRGGGLATIPVSGPHAMNTTDWFHVAVTYSGNEAAADNLKLYWTRLGSGAEKANLIGRGILYEDLNRALGDLAIGNTGRRNPYGPWEYFPGLVDEVRISSMARAPEDYFFVSPEAKEKAREEASQPKEENKILPELGLGGILVDEVPVTLPKAGGMLELGPGPHRLDFDLAVMPGSLPEAPRANCLLEGLDDSWRPTASGMTMICETLDAGSRVLSRTAFAASGTSQGWQSDTADSQLVPRTEPLFIPEGTTRLRISVSSGAPDIKGTWIIDNLALWRSDASGENLWKDGDFQNGERTNQTSGVPAGWERRGSEPAIARLVLVGEEKALGLIDAEQEGSAQWVSTRDLGTMPAKGGETFLISWSEAYNVIPGSSLRATYLSVPSGKYTFRAVAMSNLSGKPGAQINIPMVIREPFWKQPWFPPAVVAAGLILTGLGFFYIYRRRARERIARMKLQSVLEQDRARIARDMHDDLGTRVSVLNLTASSVRRAIDSDPQRAREQLLRMESSARDLVQAMEGLVWAVNPANDSLDHLAAHLASLAHDLLRDSSARLRLSIPPDLPAIPLTSDFRHHFALAVKEAVNNALKYAGPCEVFLDLSVEGSTLTVEVRDTGAGFDPMQPREGNGLRNLASRFEELGGTFVLESFPGKGTGMVFRCAFPPAPPLKKP